MQNAKQSSGLQTHILVVEDSMMEAEMLRRLLVQGGYQVAIAADGREALEKLGKIRAELIISDINMPVMNGYDLCQKIKNASEFSHIPVILLSALSEPKDIIRAMDVGADSYLIKPCNEELLFPRIRSLLAAPTETKKEESVKFQYKDEHYNIHVDSQQILNLLLSVYENTLQQNHNLIRVQEQFVLLNSQLETLVFERTARLNEEVAAHMKAEEALRLSEEMFRTAMNTARDAIILIKPPGDVYLWNEAAVNMFGFTVEEALGKGVQGLILPSCYLAQADAGLAAFFNTGWGANIGNIRQFVGMRKDGSEFPVELSVSAMNVGGEWRAMGIVRDITERKRGEAQLLKFNEELLQSLQRLTMAQKKLVISEKLASVGQLSAGVCHEILNPLNIISLYAQTLSRKSREPQVVETMEKIKAEIERVTKITGSLMTFARKGGGEARDVLLISELESVLALVEREYLLDNIKVAKDFASGPVEVRVDPDEIRQVFFNIVNNARHAMREGGTLTVSVQKVRNEEGHDLIRIRFSDTGAGIRKENLDRIFDPFFTTKPEGQGTGMGLAIVHSLIEKAGGTIVVESEEGKGAVFIIDLPELVRPG